MTKKDEVKALPEAPSVDQQLADATLSEKQMDLEIKRATIAQMEARRNEVSRVNATRVQSLKDFNASVRNEKVRCNHLKGGVDGDGKIGTGDSAKFCVFIFRYPMGERVVHCSRCQMEWHPGDKAEYLVRQGRKIKNPTGISYEHALVMAAKSGNREGSAIQFTVTHNANTATEVAAGEYPDE